MFLDIFTYLCTVISPRTHLYGLHTGVNLRVSSDVRHETTVNFDEETID